MTDTARNLCLHYMSASTPKRLLAMTEKELHVCLDAQAAAGRTAVSLAAYALGSLPTSLNYSISFDDAHRSVLSLAAPLLKTRKVPWTLFVPVLWVGTSDEWLDWDDLRALRDMGVTIGAHSMSHQRFSWKLYDEDDAAHAARLYEECARSREVLENELRTPCELFAYPYGEDPVAGRVAARRAGFAAAFTVRDTCAWDGDMFSIPRVDGLEAENLVRVKSSEPLPISVVVPARDRADMLRVTLSKLAEQSYPEDKYEVIVVDDGSRENLDSVVAAMPGRFSYVRAGNADGKFRAGQTRNIGAACAKHPVLGFLDADIAVPPDYLWALDWIHQRHNDAVVCGYLSGYNLHDMGFVHSLDAVRGAASLTDLPIISDRSREPTARGCLDNADWLRDPWKLCYTGNLSVPRFLFEKTGGFSDAFTGWGLEDLDFGYRLHRDGGTFFFSRFALGYHLVDANEGAPRNPFRRANPERADFDGYLVNLETLRRLHSGDASIEEFCARALADIDETCSRPDTVGVEFGGFAKRRAPFHARLHRCVPGGVPSYELLDRVAYAQKVRAKRLWLLGGEPLEHDGFRSVLDAARRAGIKHIGMQSHGHAFSQTGAARLTKELGVGHVTILWSGNDAQEHDALFGAGAWEELQIGLEALRTANMHMAAHVVLTSDAQILAFDATARALRSHGLKLDGVSLDRTVDASLARTHLRCEITRL